LDIYLTDKMATKFAHGIYITTVTEYLMAIFGELMFLTN